MTDAGHDAADAALDEWCREVAGVYTEAESAARENLTAYLSRFRDEDERKRQLVEDGKMEPDAYRRWRSAKVMRGKLYRQTLNDMAASYTNANRLATAMAAGKLPRVYAENYNYGAYQVETGAGVSTSFNLQDADTVQTMMKDRDAYVAKPSVNVAADKRWNRRLLGNQVTKGALLGESIDDIAGRVRNVTGSNLAAATRTARTCITAAESAGRVQSYKRAQEMGIDLTQEWLATLDGRTRHSHRQLDGEQVGVGETFSNGCRYPGDPEAPYAEIMNCRCTLVAAVAGVDTSDAKRWSKLPKGQSYEDWKSGKADRQRDSTGRTINEFMQTSQVKKQLSKRGLTESQGRKLLSEKLKTEGSSGQRFRSMAKREQRKTWNGALRETGAVSGALNDTNDPDGQKRLNHAASYYEQVRKRDRESEVSRVAANSGISESSVSKALDHLFVNEHELASGLHRFDEDYEIAQSWQRLSEGKAIKPHDLTLIRHESYEYDLMECGAGYAEAHENAERLYNYQKELAEYLKEKGES